MICSVQDCGRQSSRKGLCQTHYKRQLNGIALDAPIKRVSGGLAVCKRVDCTRVGAHSELCKKHAKEQRIGPYAGNCTVTGCDRQRDNYAGLCAGHTRLGTDDVLGPVRKIHKPIVNEKGYVLVWAPDHPYAQKRGRILEHRLVMEQSLGRYLVETEEVHHKNGNRQDNRIENLELWNTSQPPGQRVEDKLEWAREIINLYGGTND